jgi:hypothetical protein
VGQIATEPSATPDRGRSRSFCVNCSSAAPAGERAVREYIRQVMRIARGVVRRCRWRQWLGSRSGRGCE